MRNMENQGKQVCVCDAEAKNYKENIVFMVNEINDKRYLKMIYGFINRLYKDKAG